MMDSSMVTKVAQFHRVKRQCLGRTDLSRKGSIDEPIKYLVQLINSHAYYYTTSSCSGRVSLVEKPSHNAAIKKGSVFLMNKHEVFSFDEISQTVEEFVSKNASDSCLWLKYEPFIVHIQSFDIERAQSLIDIAIRCGCRNSGITVSRGDKYLVAIRSTSSMEIPLHCGAAFKLPDDYLRYIVGESNRRLNENLAKLKRFESEFELMKAKSKDGQPAESESEYATKTELSTH